MDESAAGISHIQTVFTLVVWTAIVYFVYRNFRKGRASGTASPGTAEQPTLARRLHALDEALAPLAGEASHFDEFVNEPEFKAAVALLADPELPVNTVQSYALGQKWVLSCAAFTALKQRSDGHLAATDIAAHFDEMPVWPMRFALDFLANASPRVPAGAPLAGHRDWWNDNAQLARAFAEYFTALGDDAAADLGSALDHIPADRRRQIKVFLETVRHPMARELSQKLGDFELPDHNAGSAFLGSLGRFWNPATETALLIQPEGWADALSQAERLARRKTPPLLLVSGEAMVGKTSFLKLLGTRLAADGWRVFQASGADLQAGQMYIGQLEGRIRETLAELDAGGKVIWYVPDLLALALSGTHQGQSASILDQITPAVATGRVHIWSEATPAGLARLQQMHPALRRLLEIVRLEPMDEDETLKLAGSVTKMLADKAGCGIDPSFAATAVDVAGHYLGSLCLPGAALSLLKMTAQRTDNASVTRFTGLQVLQSLAQMTGLPMSLLDGAERLDLDGVREFFSSRVIGQPEAVASIVERIAMLKSGLNDPGKPIGVFLFAGPTGTGKTELAKTTAEYLFGSQDRMIRLDMSEFQAPDSAAKILGVSTIGAPTETLVARVRKQPFSLILLDEFEKAHPMIWDLFLQVFDDGRLTDAAGLTADFRHSLIILTTNLGATSHRDSGIGFAPSASGFTNEQVLRAIGQTFRPEFQNRLDKIIVFKPLTRELMRGILTKELARLFERRGLKDRDWAVEWDASALEFLLERGFTPEMGARPLKRAIDDYVVAPLAATIVERRFPEGDQFVFMRRNGNALRADFVDPDADDPSEIVDEAPLPDGGERPALFDMMRAPAGSGSEIAALKERFGPLSARIEASAWSDEKAALAAAINAPEFWSSADRFQTLARLELMDRLAVASETARSLEARLARMGAGSGKALRDLVARQAMQLVLVGQGLKDLDDKSPAEIALSAEPIFTGGLDDSERARAWCRDIEAMYRAWAQARNMQMSEIEPAGTGSSRILLLGGFGAHRTLAREAGLHVLEPPVNEQGNRLTVQVRVAELPSGNQSRAALRQWLSAAFAKPGTGSTIVRRYRRGPSPLARNGSGSWRSGKVDEILRGNFDILGPEIVPPP